MDWFKQKGLLWIILSVVADCVLCQELTSTLREGNRTCPGEEVIFTCTVRGLSFEWISPGYIEDGSPLQFNVESTIGVDVPSRINGRITATATLTRSAIDNGEQILESTLRITAIESSTVTCRDSNDITLSVDFSVSVVPGVPLDITAREISRLDENNICIILVQWNPPTNCDAADIAQYIVYVPSRNIEMTVSSSSTFTTLTVPNCGDDTRVQVVAVNRDGCVGMNSSEVQPVLLPTVPTNEGATTTEGGSASTSSRLGAGPIAGIIIAVVLVVVGIGSLSVIGIYFFFKHFKKEDGERLIGQHGSRRIHADGGINGVEETHQSCLIKESLLSLYFALRLHSARSRTQETSDFITSAMGALRAELKKAKAIDVTAGLMSSLDELKVEKDEDVRSALDYLMEIFPDMSSIDGDFKSNVEELRNKEKSPSIKDALEVIEDKMDYTALDEIQKTLLRLCDALFQKFLKLSPKQKETMEQFEISLDSLKRVERLLSAEFTEGLKSEGEDVMVKMFVTHIHEMPKGTEEGEFLVVDLGVNRLKVLHIIIIKGSMRRKDCVEFFIGEDTKSSSYQNLFDFIVDRIAKFIKARNITKQLPIGFTFPFPMKPESLTCGKLIRWTKDFRATGAEGKDVVQLLKEATSRRGDNMQINVVALINDTTGILLSVGNEVPDCHIGLALGDGVNACYMEELSAVPKFKGDRRHKKVIVNTEWCAFGDDGKLDTWRNAYDRKLDDKSSNPKQQLFQKMISDKSQGRIVYLVLKNLINEKELFRGKSSPKFDGVDTFRPQRLSTMEGWDMKKCMKLFKDRFDIEASPKDCEVIRRVCEAVSTRAARLIAAGIVAIVNKINKIDGCTVAVDGSLYKRDRFPDKLRDALDKLAPRSDIKMKLTEDGSSIGAAFAAAMSSPPSSTLRSPNPGLEEPQELTYVNFGDRGRRHPQGGDIELAKIVEN